MTRPTVSRCQAMTLDSTGKYLYYFDNSTRYIIDIMSRKLFRQDTVYESQYAMAASNKLNYEDITVSLGEYSSLKVWDDYSYLNTYYPNSKQYLAAFSSDS